jgi:hypothetical protein
MWRRGRSLSPLRESEHQHQPNFTFNTFVFLSTHNDGSIALCDGRAAVQDGDLATPSFILRSFAQP